jgi:hypothetical protein
MAEIRLKSTGTIKLFENDNTSSVTIASPASLGGDRTITLPDASVTLASGTMLATDGSGASLTALNASELGSGTVPTARLGSGSASSSVFLAGDSTWIAAGGDNTPAFLVTKNADQTISTGTYTQVSFQTETLDTDSAYNTTDFKFTPQTAGWYFLFASVRWNTETDFDTSNLGITKNGVTSSELIAMKAAQNAYYNSMYISTIAEANGSSDFFAVNVYHTRGVSADLSSTTYTNFFGGYKTLIT